MYHIAKYKDSTSKTFTSTTGYEVIATAESREAAQNYVKANEIKYYGIFNSEEVKGEVNIGTIIDVVSEYATGNRGYSPYETVYEVRN